MGPSLQKLFVRELKVETINLCIIRRTWDFHDHFYRSAASTRRIKRVAIIIYLAVGLEHDSSVAVATTELHATVNQSR